jgi:hypothetical protein
VLTSSTFIKVEGGNHEKFQAPSSNIQRSSQLQPPNNHARRQLWYLELGISLVLGGWSLVLLEAGVWHFIFSVALSWGDWR